MDIESTKKLLLFIQAGDNRKLSEADLAYWSSEIHPGIDLDTAIEAVRIFRARPASAVKEFPYLDFTTFRIYVRTVMQRRQSAANAMRATAVAEEVKAIGGTLPPHVAVTASGLRSRDPEAWDALHSEGRAQGNADRAFTVARNAGKTDVEAKAAGEAAYHATFERIEAEKNSILPPKGDKTSPAPAGDPAPISY